MMRVEFFSADCRLCQRALDMVRARFPETEIIIHSAARCQDGRCCALAEEYGVRAIPSLVMNGHVVVQGIPSDRDLVRLQALLVGT